MEIQKYITKEALRDSVVTRDSHTCQYCGRAKLYGRRLTLDHIKPRRDGGPDSADNLFVACRQCNTQKGAKSLAQYITDRLLQIEREKKLLHALAEKIADK